MIDRPTMDTTLLDMARVLAKRSTCTRALVGTVIALDGRVLSTGYNGAPTGIQHCEHVNVTSSNESAGCETAVHAEANAIAFAAKHGVAIAGSTLYTTLAPCLKCAQLIINTGIVRVVIGKVYRDHSGAHMLGSLGIHVTSASGVSFARLAGYVP